MITAMRKFVLISWHRGIVASWHRGIVASYISTPRACSYARHKQRYLAQKQTPSEAARFHYHAHRVICHCVCYG